MESFSVAASLAGRISFLRDTKSIGDLSEMAVAYALARAGYLVTVPLGENRRYDLIIDKAGVLSRVQVKTGRLRNGAILYNTFSSHVRADGAIARAYTNEIEFFGVYCPELDSTYLVPIEDTTPCSGTLRVHPTVNGQHHHVRWAQPYLISAEPLPKLVVVGTEDLGGVTPENACQPS